MKFEYLVVLIKVVNTFTPQYSTVVKSLVILIVFSHLLSIHNKYRDFINFFFLQIFMVMVGILVMVAIVNPLMLVTTVVCGALIYFWALVYLSTAQGIKR